MSTLNSNSSAAPRSGFVWGSGGRPLSAAQARKYRDIEAAMMSQTSAPTTLGAGLNRVGEALLARSYGSQAGEAEDIGRAQVAQALQQAQGSGSSADFMGIIGSEWATPEERSLAQAQLQRSWSQEDLAAEQARPDYSTFEAGGDMYRFDANDSNATPELFFDGPASAAPSPDLVEIFDETTGMPQKGYMQGEEFVPLGGTKASPAATGDLSATETRELFQTEENILAANNVISALDTALDLNTKSASGWGAEQFAGIGANLPDWVPGLGGNETRDANTLQLKNIVTEQALSQLKLVFGAAPTEGERQILLDIQGSVNQPQEVRQRIFDRAKELAVGRLQFNEQKKDRIEQGQYGVVQPGQQMPAQGGSGGGQYATNPTTGETVMWDGQGWVPAQ